MLGISVTLVAGPAFGKKDSCDMDLTYKLANKQLRQLHYDKKTWLVSETYACCSDSNLCKESDSVNSLCCKSRLYWDSLRLQLHDIHLKSRHDLSSGDHYFQVYAPIFNQKRNACRIHVSSHQGEWGGYSANYYYKKRFWHWYLVSTVIFSVT